MRTSVAVDLESFTGRAAHARGVLYRLSAPDDPGNRGARSSSRGPAAGEREDLPYKVELWAASKASVELVLAVTANASIGYAAYYAATREFPDRYITLRHKNSIVSRWNGPGH